MSVIPKPSVMPCTTPCPSDTAATPTSAPVATGARPSTSNVGERKTASSSTTMTVVPMSDRRFASPSIRARASAEKTPGPVRSRRASAALAPAFSLRRAERLVHAANRVGLRVDVRAARAGARDEEGAVAFGRDPDAVAGARPARGLVPLHQHHGLACRVARHHLLHEQARGRGEKRQGFRDGRAQALHGEPRLGDGRAERVAVREEELALAFHAGRAAVGHRREGRVGAQAPREIPGQRRARPRVGALDAGEHDAGKRPVAQLLHEQALLRRRRGGQERREVGDEARLGHQPAGRGENREPDGDAGRARGDHGAIRRISISERSPSGCVISMRRTSAPAPPTSILSTSRATESSRGRRTSCQRRSLALEGERVGALQGFAVAGERAADALDEHRHLRVFPQRQRVALAGALDEDAVPVHDHGLAARRQGALLEAARGREAKLARGLQRPVQQREEARLVEGRAALLVGRERVHEPRERPVGGRRGPRPQGEGERARAAGSRQPASRGAQKSWKLNQLNGAARAWRSTHAA